MNESTLWNIYLWGLIPALIASRVCYNILKGNNSEVDPENLVISIILLIFWPIGITCLLIYLSYKHIAAFVGLFFKPIDIVQEAIESGKMPEIKLPKIKLRREVNPDNLPRVGEM